MIFSPHFLGIYPNIFRVHRVEEKPTPLIYFQKYVNLVLELYQIKFVVTRGALKYLT